MLPDYINRALVIIDKPPHMQSSECTAIVRKLINNAVGLGSRVQSHDWVCSDEQTVGTGSETLDPRPRTVLGFGSMKVMN